MDYDRELHGCAQEEAEQPLPKDQLAASHDAAILPFLGHGDVERMFHTAFSFPKAVILLPFT